MLLITGYRFLAVAALVATLLASPLVGLAQSVGATVARAVSVQGTVEARRTGQTSWQPVQLNDTFSPGDTIRVRERSRADLAMLDQSVLRLNANTELTVQPVKDERTGVVSLLRGAAHFFSRGPRSLEVQTPFTVAGVRGTEFYIGLEPSQALLTVFEGTIVAQNPSGSLTLTSGRQWPRPARHRYCAWSPGPATRSSGRCTIRPCSTFAPTSSQPAPIGRAWCAAPTMPT
jgi:hypothetical protein